MSLESTEAECAAKAVAPRVSLKDITRAIDCVYHATGAQAIGDSTPQHPSLDVLSICLVVMTNGFIVIGKSAPASPENFDAELGKKLAYEDCIRQLWPLMGFALREKLSQSGA